MAKAPSLTDTPAAAPAQPVTTQRPRPTLSETPSAAEPKANGYDALLKHRLNPLKPVEEQETAFMQQEYQNNMAPIGDESVKQMQQAIINFGKFVASDLPAARQNASGVEQIEGADSWLNFLTNAYANKAKTVGKQLVNTNVKQPTRMDTSKPNDNFRGMINSLMRIGKHDSENTPDGMWGARTTNALRNIYAFAHSIVEIQQDMGMSSSYGSADLTEFYNTLPRDKEPVPETAPDILTKNIQKLTNGYIDFKDKVLHNPQYKDFITQNKPLVSLKNEQPMNEQEQLLMKSYGNSGLRTQLNKTDVMIAPQDLVNIGAFKNFVGRVGPQIGIPQQELQEALTSNQGAIQSMLQEVMQGLNQVAL